MEKLNLVIISAACVATYIFEICNYFADRICGSKRNPIHLCVYAQHDYITVYQLYINIIESMYIIVQYKINMFENSFSIKTLVNTCVTWSGLQFSFNIDTKLQYLCIKRTMYSYIYYIYIVYVSNARIRFVVFICNLEMIMPYFRTT